MPKNFDFSGYATKHDVKCSDGRTIKKDSFKHQHGETVPLVWQHMHSNPENILGKAYLEHRDDGVYAYGHLNNSESATQVKELLKHGDVNSLSIFANQLKQNGSDVIHGKILEVSLVLSGANPGAKIDNIQFAHSDGSVYQDDSEAVITSGTEIQLGSEEIEHGSTEKEATVEEILDSMNEQQRALTYALVADALESGSSSNTEDVSHSIQGGNEMKKNVFDKQEVEKTNVLSHSQIKEIFDYAASKKTTLKEAVLQHAGTYGIDDIEILFPDAQALAKEPTFISRDMAWVSTVLQGTHHSPFSRIKSVQADITADEARAKGYIKGNQKKEEVFKLLKRVTTPTTIYKKQKLDRDDVVDIKDFNVVSFVKSEMRTMLNEELARAILVGDGRPAVGDDDKINEENIRPIWTDADLYSHHVYLETDPLVNKTVQFMESVVRAMEHYKGKGSPKLFTTRAMINDMILLKDSLGRRLYNNMSDLVSALTVDSIVEVPVMQGLTRTVAFDGVDTDVTLEGIIVNLKDYVIGTDAGGEVNMFDDFDIDFNQLKFLLETRCSGALKDPKTALVIERKPAVVPPAG